MRLARGDNLGPYVIEDQLGAGGMGEVYRAWDTRLKRHVAIKVLLPARAADSARRQRLLREARAASALNHPNILTVYDIGAHKGMDFLVMELVSGKSLASVIGSEPLSVADTLRYALQATDALAAAHAAGIIHRDLKPGNIMVTESRHLKLLDFGLAKIAADSAPLGEDEETRTLVTETESGTIQGTTAYMSPEQAQGRTVDARSDVFSFGAVLYDMITGQPPFRGRTPAMVFDALLNREPEPVSRLNRHVPPDLEEIVARALRKDRAKRYQSILDLRADLIRLEQELASGAEDAAHRLPKSITARPNTFLDSIAVLPFDNPLNDPETEYLADGIAETILNYLSQLTKVRVVPRTTVFRYRRSAADPVSIGRQLGVRLVLIGRVLVQKGRLTVGTELVDTEQEAQVWGERYNRGMEDLLSVHEEIAGAIANNLRLRIGERERQLLTRRATESREAFHLFLKGWYHANQWTPEGLRKGIDYGRRAIQEDPSYAEPYALLAYVYSMLGMLGGMRPADVLPKAKAAALSAVERNEHAGSPRVALALVRLLYEWDWKGARQELKRAFELEPNDPYCHLCYGVWLNAMGQSEEAIHEMKVALDTDPLSTLISHNLAGVYSGAGLEDQAIEQHLRSVELNPAFPAAHGQLALLYSRRGACEKALEEVDRFLSLSGRDSRSRCFLAMVYANCGMRVEAMACIEDLEKEAPFHGAAGLAFAYAALGERDRAFACLEKSYEDRDVFLPFLQILPEFRSLHDDPRFTDLLRRIGLPVHTSGAVGEKAAR